MAIAQGRPPRSPVAGDRDRKRPLGRHEVQRPERRAEPRRDTLSDPVASDRQPLCSKRPRDSARGLSRPCVGEYGFTTPCATSSGSPRSAALHHVEHAIGTEQDDGRASAGTISRTTVNSSR